MPRNIEQVIGWTRDPVNRNRHRGGNWHNRCEQYINNAGDFDESFDTAWLAAQASGPLTESLDGIPDGAVGYWRGVWIEGEECGHDAFWYQGVWWMASDACGEARAGLGGAVGNGTGWITATEYARLRPAAIWQGWALRHGSETLAGATLAGSTTPLKFQGEDDMKHIYHPARGYAIIGFDGAYGYKDGAVDAIAARGITSSVIYVHDWEWDTDVREANIRGEALRALQTAHTLRALQAAGLKIDIDEQAIGKATAALIPTPAVDVMKLAAALKAAGVGDGDPAKVAAAVNTALRDDFAAIPGAVRSAIVK